MAKHAAGASGGDDGTRVELSLDTQLQMLAALRRRLSADGEVQRIDTHISVVLVHGGQAWKFKKALKTAFLDQSTLAHRQAACAEELRLNRRFAPDLYLGVVSVTGSLAQPELGGTGPVLDVAVQMRAFDDTGLWDRLAAAGQLGAAQTDDLAATVARFHDGAAVADPSWAVGSPQQQRLPVVENLDELEALTAGAGMQAALRRLREAEARDFARLAGLMVQRLADGAVRECHGDLHLGNVVQIAGRATPFDGIEFKPAWRWIDVVNELAFMAMDLHAHGLSPLAHRFVDAWLQRRGDYEGLPLLPYFMAYRAAVRAKVALLRAAQPGADRHRETRTARHYLALALRLAHARGAACRPALLITHGPSGSGKTTLTQALLEAAGAVRIRADVERKRLAGLAALAHSGSAVGGGLYGPAMTAATYARLLQAAAPVVDAGCIAILDATFLRHAQREAARRWAAERDLPFVVLDFPATPALLRQRLHERAVRGGDASEADVQVLEMQLRTAEPLRPDERGAVFTVAPSAAAGLPAMPVAAWRPLLDQLRAGDRA
ncbi:MAG: AAA family ATPase [Betaproteobacteria bacterium]|nr:AAA family ATPase [Betaproteobacteria bacterium]